MSRKTKRFTSHRRVFQFESLEPRAMMSATPLLPPALAKSMAIPLVQIAPQVLTDAGPKAPNQIRQAYGFNAQSYNGAGETIAIVEGDLDPTIKTDVVQFDNQTNTGPINLVPHNVGAGSADNANWDLETALDVEYAHVIAPAATILLVETDGSVGDLMEGVQYAASQPNVSVISMSWASPELAGEMSSDSYYFSTPSGHIPITYVAASGDTGAGVDWPAVSKNVLAVGGTTLATVAVTYNYYGEDGWSGSSGGVSAYEAKPSYQNAVQTYGTRTTPDVAYDANPASGFAVFTHGNWTVVGGTSAGAPQWAALIALANQGRAEVNRPPLANAIADMYAAPASDFNDVTIGSNGAHAAHAGYDLVTGLGSPIANKLIPALINMEPVVQITHIPVTGLPILPASATISRPAVQTLVSQDVAAAGSTASASRFTTSHAALLTISSPEGVQANQLQANDPRTPRSVESAADDAILWHANRSLPDHIALRDHDDAADDLLEALFQIR